MGLDAIVRCNCYRDGRATPLPFPAEYLELNDNGTPVGIRDGSIGVSYTDFSGWRDRACQHRHMELVGVRVANWWGYRSFQGALEKVGWENFPVLQEHLPEGNGGELPADQAAQALAELAFFKQCGDKLGNHSVLANTETNGIVYANPGLFVWNGHKDGVDIGFDQNGLYINHRDETGGELFRARRVEQLLLEPTLTQAHQDGRVQYTNLDNGVQFSCSTSISGHQIPWPDGQEKNAAGQIRFEYPRYLHVEERPLTPAYFDYILQPLTQLIEAAELTGNPVEWC